MPIASRQVSASLAAADPSSITGHWGQAVVVKGL